jgi:hypothetical protein
VIGEERGIQRGCHIGADNAATYIMAGITILGLYFDRTRAPGTCVAM